MVAVMGIERHAAFYRGYQPDDRSLFPVAMVLATIVALWLLVYMVSALGPHTSTVAVQRSPHAAFAVSHAVRQ